MRPEHHCPYPDIPAVEFEPRSSALLLFLSFASLCAIAFFLACISATSYAQQSIPSVSPLDQERDYQDKLRLQEKITRELEENRRRVVKEKAEKLRKSDEVNPQKKFFDEELGQPSAR